MINLVRNKTASFDIDPQKTFTEICPDELPVPNALEIVNELNRNNIFASVRIGSKDAHSPDAIWISSDKNPQFSRVCNGGQNVDVHWNSHAMIGTKGFSLIDNLPKVEDYDFFVWKGIENNMHPYGACYHDLNNKLSTGVIEFLKQKGISTVIVGGLAFEFCVKNTIIQLVEAGFYVVINLAATRSLTKKNHLETIEFFKHFENVRIINSSYEIKNIELEKII